MVVGGGGGVVVVGGGVVVVVEVVVGGGVVLVVVVEVVVVVGGGVVVEVVVVLLVVVAVVVGRGTTMGCGGTCVMGTCLGAMIVVVVSANCLICPRSPPRTCGSKFVSHRFRVVIFPGCRLPLRIITSGC